MDKKKVEKLFKGCYRQMYAIARSILGDDDESRDAVNDAFARLLSADIWVEEGNEERFLATCVRNNCLNRVKHKSVHERFARMYFSSASADMRDDSYWKDATDAVMAFVESNFSERMQRIFHLRFVDGLKYEEIAAELEVSRVTVYKDLFRGVDMIKKTFKTLL